MDTIRKRVTRVGSGAFSIYLPKKWIDGWTREQQQDREVELREVGQGLLVVPVLRERSHRHAIAPVHAAVRTHLLSAYVRGFDDVLLTPSEGAFDNDCVAAARDFLRHLDERLVATSGSAGIGFRLHPELPSPASSGPELLGLLVAKVREVLSLAADAVTAYAHDPDRTLHALRLLRDTHDEDVSRLFHQSMRWVATLEIPLESVSGYQLLGFAANELHQISAQAGQIGHTIGLAYGLEEGDLDYPRPHLLAKIGTTPALSGVASAMVRAMTPTFTDLDRLLARLGQALQTNDIEALAAAAKDAVAADEAAQRRIFAAVADRWGEEVSADALPTFYASRMSTRLASVHDRLAATARMALALLAAGDQ